MSERPTIIDALRAENERLKRENRLAVSARDYANDMLDKGRAENERLLAELKLAEQVSYEISLGNERLTEERDRQYECNVRLRAQAKETRLEIGVRDGMINDLQAENERLKTTLTKISTGR